MLVTHPSDVAVLVTLAVRVLSSRHRCQVAPRNAAFVAPPKQALLVASLYYLEQQEAVAVLLYVGIPSNAMNSVKNIHHNMLEAY